MTMITSLGQRTSGAMRITRLWSAETFPEAASRVGHTGCKDESDENGLQKVEN